MLNKVYYQSEINQKKVSLIIDLQKLLENFHANLVTRQYIEYETGHPEICQIKAIGQQGIQLYVPSQFQTIFISISDLKQKLNILEYNKNILGNHQLFYQQNEIVQNFQVITYQFLKLFREQDLDKIWPLQFQQTFKADFYFFIHQLYQSIIEYPYQFLQDIIVLFVEYLNFVSKFFDYLKDELELMYLDKQDISQLKYVDINLMFLSGVQQIFELIEMILGIKTKDCQFYKFLNDVLLQTQNKQNQQCQSISEYFYDQIKSKNIQKVLKQYYLLEYTVIDQNQQIENLKIQFSLMFYIHNFLENLAKEFDQNEFQEIMSLKFEYINNLNKKCIVDASPQQFLEFVQNDKQSQKIENLNIEQQKQIYSSLILFLNEKSSLASDNDCDHCFSLLKTFQNSTFKDQIIPQQQQKNLIFNILQSNQCEGTIKISNLISQYYKSQLDQRMFIQILQIQKNYLDKEQKIFSKKLQGLFQNMSNEIFQNFLQSLQIQKNFQEIQIALIFFESYYLMGLSNEADVFLLTEFQNKQIDKQYKNNLENLIEKLFDLIKSDNHNSLQSRTMNLTQHIFSVLPEDIDIHKMYQQEINLINFQLPILQSSFLFYVLLKKIKNLKKQENFNVQIFFKSFLKFFETYTQNILEQKGQQFIRYFFECTLIMCELEKNVMDQQEISYIIILLCKMQDNYIEIIIRKFINNVCQNFDIAKFFDNFLNKILEQEQIFIPIYCIIIEQSFIYINQRKGSLKILCNKGKKIFFEILEPQKLHGIQNIWLLLQKQMLEKEIQTIFGFLTQIYKSFNLFLNLEFQKILFEDLLNKIVDLCNKASAKKQYVLQNFVFEFLAIYFQSFLVSQKKAEQADTQIQIKNRKNIDQIYIQQFSSLMDVYNILIKKKLVKNTDLFVLNDIPIQNVYRLTQLDIQCLKQNEQQLRQMIFCKSDKQSNYKEFQSYIKHVIQNDLQFGFVLQKLFETDNQFVQNNFEKLFKVIPIHNIYVNYLQQILEQKKSLFQELQPQNNFKFNFYVQILIQQIKNKKILFELSHLNIDLFIDLVLDIQQKDVLDYKGKIKKQSKIIQVLFDVLQQKNKSMYFNKEKIESIIQYLYEFYIDKNFEQMSQKKVDHFIENTSNFLFVMLQNQALDLKFILNFVYTFYETNQSNSQKFTYHCCVNLKKIQKFDQQQISQLTNFFNQKYQILQDQNQEKQNIDQNKQNYFVFVLQQIVLILKNSKKKFTLSNSQIFLLQNFGFNQVLFDVNIDYLILFNGILLNLYKIYPQKSLNIDEYIERNILITSNNDMSQERYLIFQNQKKFVELLKFVEYFTNSIYKRQMESLFVKFFIQQSYRTDNIQDWFLSFKFTQPEKNKQFTGLENLGSTCYINSNLQQLYHIKPFQNFILNLDQIQDKQTLYEIQQCFVKMKFSQLNSVCPDNLIKKMKNFDGTDIDVNEQRDAQEFLVNIMDKMEEELKSLNKQDFLKDNFMGEVYQEIVGMDCQHKSIRTENFLTFGVQIKNLKNLNQSLQKSIEWEYLNKSNQYFCDSCKKKVDAKKRILLNKLPNFLVIYLQRFEYDLESLKKLKLNDYFEFPDNLNLVDFCQENINNQSLQKPQYYQYKLKGVVIHQGSGDSGHYFSYINFGNWIELNDQKIKQIDKRELNQVAFGNLEYDHSNKSAYIVYYERVQIIEANNFITNGINQNKIHQLKKNLSKAEYIEYIKNLLAHRCFQIFIKDNVLKNAAFERVSIVYFVIYFLRDANIQNQYGFLKNIEKTLYKPNNAIFFVQNLNFLIIYECLIKNPRQVSKNFFLSLLIQSTNSSVNILKQEQLQTLANTVITLLKYIQQKNEKDEDFIYFVSNLCKNDHFLKAAETQGLKEYFVLYYQQQNTQNVNIIPQTSVFYEDNFQKLSIQTVKNQQQEGTYERTKSQSQNQFHLLLQLILKDSRYMSVIPNFKEFQFLTQKMQLVEQKQDIINFSELIIANLPNKNIFDIVIYLQFDYNNIQKILTYLANFVIQMDLEGLNEIVIEKVIDFVDRQRLNNIYVIFLIIQFLSECSLKNKSFQKQLIYKESFIQSFQSLLYFCGDPYGYNYNVIQKEKSQKIGFQQKLIRQQGFLFVQFKKFIMSMIKFSIIIKICLQQQQKIICL